MKFRVLFLMLLLSTYSFGQAGFVWDVTDTTSKTKKQIYDLTKLFINEIWVSANNVIQMDDSTVGII